VTAHPDGRDSPAAKELRKRVARLQKALRLSFGLVAAHSETYHHNREVCPYCKYQAAVAECMRNDDVQAR
jgi:hypothetical protein